ncbi:hypothetical protein D3C75_921780 [compost metagenome]
MITEILEQILLGGPVFGEDNHLFVHFPDQLHGFFRFRVRFDGAYRLKQLHHPLTLGRVGRELLDQVDEGDEDGIPAAAHLPLKRDQRQHAAEIAARFLILVFDKGGDPVI